LLLPALFKIEKEKSYTVADKLEYGVVPVWNWVRMPTLGAEAAQFQVLLQLINGCNPGNGMDKWLWEVGETNTFSVKSVRKLLEINRGRACGPQSGSLVGLGAS